MDFFEELEQLLAALHDDKKRTYAVYVLVENRQEQLTNLFHEVIVEQGMGKVEYLPSLAEYREYLLEFYYPEQEKKKFNKTREKWSADTEIHSFLRLVVQHWWGSALCKNKKKRDEVLRNVMREKPSIIKLIKNKIYKETDKKHMRSNAFYEDLFTDVIAIIIKGMNQGKYKGGSIMAYINTTVINSLKTQFRKDKNNKEGRHFEELPASDEAEGNLDTLDSTINDETDDRINRLSFALKMLDDKCRNLIKLVFYNKTTAKETDKQLYENLGYEGTGYQSYPSFRNAKSNCIEKLRNFF